MNTENLSFTITVSPPSPTHSSVLPDTEMARPLEPCSTMSYYLPPPQTQAALRLSRQIGVSIESSSPFTVKISSPPASTHPEPIHHPHSPPPLNIPTSLPHRIHKSAPESEEDEFSEHLRHFINHCYHELDILETRRRDAKELYHNNIAHEVLTKKYDKMWRIWEESQKLFKLLNE